MLAAVLCLFPELARLEAMFNPLFRWAIYGRVPFAIIRVLVEADITCLDK